MYELSRPQPSPRAPSPVDQVAPSRISRAASTTLRVPVVSRLRLADLATYGPLIRVLASRDLKARYKQSALGPAWVVFQPLALLAAFTVGFRSVAHVHTGGVPYILFALTGLVVWTYFQAVLLVAVSSLVNNLALVRWTACPRLALPLATLLSNLPSFVVTVVAAILAAGVGGYLWLGTLLLPFLCIWMFGLVAAGAIFLSGITVRARDVLSVLPFLLQVTLFLSPVAYGTSHLSPLLRTLISINPLTGLIEAWRWSLLGIRPGLGAVSVSLVLTALGLVLGWRFFARFEVKMADEI